MFSKETMNAVGNMMIGAGISSMILSCIMIYVGKNYYITMTKINKNYDNDNIDYTDDNDDNDDTDDTDDTDDNDDNDDNDNDINCNSNQDVD